MHLPATAHPASPHGGRLPLVNALKALAAQCIVLHHFAAYGPLSREFARRLPATWGWLYDYGLFAVQIFLVVGGFLAARSLAPSGRWRGGLLPAILWRRYRRLMPPLLATLPLAIVATAIARNVLDEAWVPATPGLLQVVAHVFLLQDLVGVAALSAGIWYVAIDFQLFVLLALMLRGAARAGEQVARWLLLSCALLALFFFNRDDHWDTTACYFFGSYALGAAAWWQAGAGGLSSPLSLIWPAALLSLIVDFRPRLAVALLTALALLASGRRPRPERWLDSPLVAFLAKISYALFLVHFPIWLLANACFARFGAAVPALALPLVAVAWAASIALAAAFQRWFEAAPAGAG
jgi:peptidoglycan/LPS O-acetylase OafA/YrhL